MAFPRFETVSGVVDGSNTAFITSRPYTAGSLAVLLNGLLLVQPLINGWSETDPSTGGFDLNIAPELGDHVQAFYIDTAPASVETEVRGLKGSIRSITQVSAAIHPFRITAALVAKPTPLVGRIVTVRVRGVVDKVATLTGSLREVF